jgi:hypothetical protein
MKIKILLAMFLALSLAACNTTPDTKLPPTNDFVIVHPDPVPALDLNKVEWQIWNLERITQESKKPENKDKTYYVLAPEQATALFDNLIDISDVLKKSTKSIEHYRTSIDEYNAKKDKAEAEAKAAAEEAASKSKKGKKDK